MLAAFSARFAKRRRRPGKPLPVPSASPSSAPSVAAQPARPAAAEPRTLSRSFSRQERRTRRLDIVIALGVSAAAHTIIALLPGEKPVSQPAPSAPERREIAALIELPELDEIPAEAAESEPSETPPMEFAPPMQAELPSIVTVDSFVQPMQPPVPAGISTDATMLVVPPTAPIGAGGAAPKLFDIAELDRVPNRIRTGPLTYPPEFLRSKTEGDVVLLLLIDPTGRVEVERVLVSSHPEFTRAAVLAAELSRYEAPRKGGAPVTARYTLRVPFRLDEN